MNPAADPRSAAQTEGAATPGAVRLAVLALGASLVPGVVRVQLTEGWFDSAASMLTLAGILTLAGLLLRGLWRGNNVLRWLTAAFFGLGIVLMPWSLPTIELRWERGVLLAQGLLQALAIALLFAPSARLWFRRRRRSDAPEGAADDNEPPPDRGAG